MKEIEFLNKNQAKWENCKKLFNSSTPIDSDVLAQNYLELLNDLSYARTYYPKGKSTVYLNQLTKQLHLQVYKSKKSNFKQLVEFWTKDIPTIYYEYRKYILISFLIFALFSVVGWISSSGDDEFVRFTLGDYYVNITEQNIEDGDPMKIYKSKSQSNMFLRITVNNIMVSIYAFILGLVFSLGTVYVLMNNGIMIGAFHYIFYEHDRLGIALQTIWLHGTLEITAIIIAGAAGILLGSSYMFPGTYTRYQSFVNQGKKAFLMIIGLVPVFIAAGFIESFITRHYQYSFIQNMMVITLSIAFILWYYVIYPRKLIKGVNNGTNVSN